jgi:hypothetical protein
MNNNLNLWIAPGYVKYVGTIEVLAGDLSQACRLVTSQASALLKSSWNGQPVIAAGFDHQVDGRQIPHLGYNVRCAEGCGHPQPPLGRKAFRFFGFWFITPYPADGDPGAGLEAVELGPLHVEVLGKYGKDFHRPPTTTIYARSLRRPVYAAAGI